ncbi:MAG TPA: Gfo/Idh/MocA family oxidoreductase [Tepidisphaeraceae bacterium]|jgi:predicted dehydrogenase
MTDTNSARSTASASSGKLRVAVIGCGAIGQRRHIPEAFSNPRVQLVALCDLKPGRAQEVGAKYGTPTAYTDHREMIAREKPDIVVVGTPNALHAAQAIDALQAGCHVLVEKPMATSIDEANAMIAAAEKAGRFLMVGQNQRLMPPHVKAKQILDSGILGQPISFQTTFKHPGPDGWSVDGATSWFFKKELAAMGVCADLGVHKIDLMRYLLGQEITDVTGFIGTLNKTQPNSDRLIEIDDTAFLSVRTDKGVIGSITISWTQYGHFEDNSTTIYCEQGVLEIATNPEFSVIVHGRDGSKAFYKTGAVATNTQQTNSGVIDAFIESVTSKRPPTIDGREGLKALRVILAAFDASREGKISKVATTA